MGVVKGMVFYTECEVRDGGGNSGFGLKCSVLVLAGNIGFLKRQSLPFAL